MERTRTYSRAVLLAALIGLWLLPLRWAEAAPAFTPPSGWDEGPAASEEAQRRADAWAKAWSAKLLQVISTRSDDGFAETLAILDVAEPIPAQALAELDAGRSWLEPRVSAALGSAASLDPEALELLSRPEPGVAVLVGRVQQRDRVAWIAAAPRGPRHVAVVLLVPAAEEILYANVFDDAVGELDDLRAPIAPFRRAPLRWGALGAWLVVGASLGVEWTRRALPRPGARVAGRQAALMLLGVAVLVLVIAGLWLRSAAAELALVEATPWGLALELALGGALTAGLVLLGTELLERRLEPVASAPRQGTFARMGAPRRRAAPELGDPITQPLPSAPRPIITGDTQVGPPPAVTGDTQVGPPPAVTGNTKIGPPPQPIAPEDLEAGPPVREIISGDIEVRTQVRRVPEPDTVKTAPPAPPALAATRPKLEIDWS